MRTIKIRRSLVEAAEEQIRDTADELRWSHTLHGKWPDEDDAKEHHDFLIDLADRLAEALQ